MPRFTRTALVGALAALAALGVTSCEESSPDPSSSILQAWRRAGLMPTVFTSLDDKRLAPGNCQQGTVDGLSVSLCHYAEAAAARAAQSAGLERVGEATGLSVAAGDVLLIAIDQDAADPSGRTLNRLATVFRDTQSPTPKPGDADEAASAAGDGDKSASDASAQ
ncbi:MAG: hypothetical protein Tsb0020_34120 [Haliangiales bacterium]